LIIEINLKLKKKEDFIKMRPTKLGIQALLNAADKIKNDSSDFKWNVVTKCTCATVAKEVLKLSNRPGFYIEDIHGINGLSWTKKAREQFYCASTGLEMIAVFSLLKEAGFETSKDFEDLEFLGQLKMEDYYELEYNEKKELESQSDSFAQPQAVVNKLRELAHQLQLQLINQEASQKQQLANTVAVQAGES
jgi:hypothetical protein